MHSYPHHIGDFRSGTVNMTRQERWIYRDMTDVYYDTEKPLTLDLDVLCNEIGVRTDDERAIVQLILKFKFKRTDDGYVHVRCEEVIAEYRKKADIARENGNRGGRPKKANDKQEKPSGFPSGSDVVATGNQEETGSKTNHKPITNNQEPKSKAKGARAPLASPDPLPEWLPVDAWTAYAEMRQKIRKPMTPAAQKLVIAKLDGFKQSGHLPRDVLEQSIRNSWQDVYETKGRARDAPAARPVTTGRHSGFNEIDYHEGVTADGVF